MIQSGSEYDISCGVIYLKPPLHAQDVASWDKRDSWIREVSKRIGLGVEVHEILRYEILRYGAKALNVKPEQCERQYIPIEGDVEMQVCENTGEVFVMIHCGSRGFGWQTLNWDAQQEQSGSRLGILFLFRDRCPTITASTLMT